MSWYAFRTIYDWDIKPDDTAVLEQRIVVFGATSWEEAHANAHTEADAYAEALGFTAHPIQVGYKQDEYRPMDRYEVWPKLERTRDLPRSNPGTRLSPFTQAMRTPVGKL